MLDQSTDSITTIASSVGFRDANYFSKVFRKWEQMPPYDYRHRKKEERVLQTLDVVQINDISPRDLAIVRSTRQLGEIGLRVHADGLIASEFRLFLSPEKDAVE